MLSLGIVCFCLLIPVSVAGAKKSEMLGCEEPRDTSAYEQGGPFVTDLNTSPKARRQVSGQVREFLWAHWIKRAPARLAIVSGTKEGESVTSSYLVEPSDEGIWRVCVVIESTLINRKNPAERIRQRKSYAAARIERVEVRATGLAPYEIIPDTDQRPPDRYRIVLKDVANRVLVEL